MKKIIASLVCLIFISCSSDKTTAELKLDSIQCLMCSYSIEENLRELRGVKKVQVDLKNKSGRVVFNANIIDLSTIENKITSIGYNVNNKLADIRAYEKLELCCKKPKEN